jgi:hypothetical protein
MVQRVGGHHRTSHFDEQVPDAGLHRQQDGSAGQHRVPELSTLHLHDDVRLFELIDDRAEGRRSLDARCDEQPQVGKRSPHVAHVGGLSARRSRGQECQV